MKGKSNLRKMNRSTFFIIGARTTKNGILVSRSRSYRTTYQTPKEGERRVEKKVTYVAIK